MLGRCKPIRTSFNQPPKRFRSRTPIYIYVTYIHILYGADLVVSLDEAVLVPGLVPGVEQPRPLLQDGVVEGVGPPPPSTLHQAKQCMELGRLSIHRYITSTPAQRSTGFILADFLQNM